jgi:hypothetical protein
MKIRQTDSPLIPGHRQTEGLNLHMKRPLTWYTTPISNVYIKPKCFKCSNKQKYLKIITELRLDEFCFPFFTCRKGSYEDGGARDHVMTSGDKITYCEPRMSLCKLANCCVKNNSCISIIHVPAR